MRRERLVPGSLNSNQDSLDGASIQAKKKRKEKKRKRNKKKEKKKKAVPFPTLSFFSSDLTQFNQTFFAIVTPLAVAAFIVVAVTDLIYHFVFIFQLVTCYTVRYLPFLRYLVD